MSSKTLHAFEFLNDVDRHGDKPVFVLYGDDRFLQVLARRALLASIASVDAEVRTFDGETSTWADVADEVSTLSLFDQQSPRVVVVDDANNFVKEYRKNLETFVQHPAVHSKLVLIVTTWTANTNLYKLVNKFGCQIHCGEPKTKGPFLIKRWITARAKSEFGLTMSNAVAAQLLDLVEWDLGRADQELAKLQLFVGSGKVSEANVREVVGGWVMQSIWETAKAAASGDTAEAFNNLSMLMQSGEYPVALFGPLSWSLRRYARVWDLVTRRTGGRTPDLSVALRQAGFRSPEEMSQAESHLKQLRRDRVKQLLRWLVETDLSLKGTHSAPHRARLALELLIARLSSQLSPRQSADA